MVDSEEKSTIFFYLFVAIYWQSVKEGQDHSSLLFPGQHQLTNDHGNHSERTPLEIQPSQIS
jgi:hypothetical protein